MKRLFERLRSWLRPHPVVTTETSDVPPGPRRGPMDLVVVLDGTMGHLRDPLGHTNAGRAFLLLREQVPGRRRALYYEPGLQWEGWRKTLDVMLGRGINRQIRRAYGWLACHYRPGDRIYLLGYSRGAFAVRSLAGVIDRVGLLRADAATERYVQLAYRHYERDPERPAARAFARRHCHANTPIEMVGVWDTVKALGLRLPLLWMLTEARHRFHDQRLGAHIRFGAQALALDETRAAFQPILWEADAAQRIEQVWFRGSHADIGGQLDGFEAARPLANIPLVWMLGRAAAQGLPLPAGWRAGLPCDPDAPSVGSWRGWGRAFLLRAPRTVGTTGTDVPDASALPYDGPALIGAARRPRWRTLRKPLGKLRPVAGRLGPRMRRMRLSRRAAAATPPETDPSQQPPPAAL